MQECVTEFIGFVTGETFDKCHKENRKTREKASQGKTVEEEEEEGGVLLFGNNRIFSHQEIRDDEAIMFGNEEGKDDQLPILEFTIIDPKGLSMEASVNKVSNVGLSASRVRFATQLKAMKHVCSSPKLEVTAFAQFRSDQ
ncbi:ATP synthase subunit alpha mitochondrial [Bienertia sinuspersici]